MTGRATRATSARATAAQPTASGRVTRSGRAPVASADDGVEVVDDSDEPEPEAVAQPAAREIDLHRPAARRGARPDGRAQSIVSIRTQVTRESQTDYANSQAFTEGGGT